MRTPDPPGARRVTRLKINSLASTTTTFGSKTVDLTKISGITRGNVIKTRLDPPTRKDPEMTNQDPASIAARIENLEATIQRVRDLHSPEDDCANFQHTRPGTMCPDCYIFCASCQQHYPCRTIQTLEGDEA